jgi:hypothetical protein
MQVQPQPALEAAKGHGDRFILREPPLAQSEEGESRIPVQPGKGDIHDRSFSSDEPPAAADLSHLSHPTRNPP